VVKRLDRLLIELKDWHKTLSVNTYRAHLIHTSPPAQRKADGHADGMSTKHINSRNRLRRLASPSTEKINRSNRAHRIAARVSQLPDIIMDFISEEGCEPGDSPDLANHSGRSRRSQRPTVRPVVSRKVRKVRRVTSDSTSIDLHTRSIENDAPEAAQERKKQHIKRQELRSRRRMQLFCARTEWLRHTQERAAAGDDLWQRVQDEEHAVARKDDLWAWPRLAERQREHLADEVQAFVRGRE
jgi:hypothetical protein